MNDNIFKICYHISNVVISGIRFNIKMNGWEANTATAKQLNALIRAHFDEDNEKFKTISLQIAAHEVKVGHMGCAKEIKDLIQNVKYSKKKVIPFGKTMTASVIANEINLPLYVIQIDK